MTLRSPLAAAVLVMALTGPWTFAYASPPLETPTETGSSSSPCARRNRSIKVSIAEPERLTSARSESSR